MKESGYYPPGAEFDPNAPYNQPLDVDYDRFVSITVSFNYTYSGSPNLDKEDVKNIIKDEVLNIVKANSVSKLNDFSIDDIEIIEE